VEQKYLVFRVHAFQRMFQRSMSKDDIRKILSEGKTIKNYPDDKPYPSRLVLGWIEQRPIHIVVADNIKDNQEIVITVYEPDPAQWEEGFERRK